MRRVASLPFVLLWELVPILSGLKLLLSAPPLFNCSQPDLNCSVRESTCLLEWLKFSNLTPSAPSSVYVFIDTLFDEDGKLVPVLNIEWKAATDASITHLKGVELAVLQESSNQQICTQFDFGKLLSQVRPNGGGRWNFSFNRFEVQPGHTYQVTVHHLPKLSTSGDHNKISCSITVPDCRNQTMKKTEPCIQIGSLWEPRIDGTRLSDDSVLVSFNTSVLSATYFIYVTSLQEDGKKCKTVQKTVSEEGPQQRKNVTIKLERNLKICCKYEIQIEPQFPACGSDCPRRSIFVPCPIQPVIKKMGEPNELFLALPWGLTVFCILLLGSSVAAAVCLIRRHKGLNSGANNGDWKHPDSVPMLQPPPALKPCKVWIVYSADHRLYVDIVMKFAQFMITVCGTEVILDLLEERQISEIGALCWLTRQKQEMEALSSKIIILCSRGTRAKWQAMLGHEKAAVHLKQDKLLPTGDMFTPALNLILPDFKQPACFGMYLICYFEGVSDERDIPDPFHVTSKYQLMDRFEEIYFLIQDLEKFEPGRIHQIPIISPEKYSESPNGRQLKEALQKFQKWQAEHPDWFKNECTCSEAEADQQSLNGELTEDLELPKEGILQKQVLSKEPDPNSCCLVRVLVNEDNLGAYKLKPHLPPREDLAFQTVVIPVETSTVQMVVPTDPAEEKEILSHKLLTNEVWLDREPKMEVIVPRRNSVILQEELSSDPQVLSDDMRQQLEGLMYSFCQQSIISPDLPLCQEGFTEQQQLVFDESCKMQRQSVQSDQGYISRCSPLLSEGPVEEEEEEESQEEERYWTVGHPSADVLSSLKSLQQQLLFQDIHKSCS